MDNPILNELQEMMHIAKMSKTSFIVAMLEKAIQQYKATPDLPGVKMQIHRAAQIFLFKTLIDDHGFEDAINIAKAMPGVIIKRSDEGTVNPKLN